MIKEIIFSGKKYFESNEPNYIGKRIVGVKREIQTYGHEDFEPISGVKTIPPSTERISVQVSGRYSGGGTFVILGKPNLHYIFRVADILANGGDIE